MLFDEDVLLRQQRGDVRVRDRLEHRGAEGQEPVALGPLLLRAGGAADLELDAGELGGAGDRLVALRRRRPPERDDPQRARPGCARRRRRRRCRCRGRSRTTLPDSSGNERRSTLRRRPTSRSASDQRAAALPVREPEQHGTRCGSSERRGEQDVARDHVRHEGDRPRVELLAERRSRNSRTRPAWRRRSEQVDAAVRRQHAVDGAHRRGRRARRPARRARSSFGTVAPSTGSAGSTTCVAKIRRPLTTGRARAGSPRTAPASTASGGSPRARPPPSRSASSRSVSTRTSASASSASVVDEQAADAVLDHVADAADAHRDRRAAAQERLDQHAAEPLGARRQHEARRLVERTRRPPAGLEPLDPRVCSGRSRTSSLDHLAPRAAADDPSRAPGTPRRRAAPRAREPVDVLVELEHADEERRRAARAAAPAGARGTRSRSMNVGNSAAGSTPSLADEARGVRRDRAHRVGPAKAAGADGVGDRREQRAAQRRAVEPRGVRQSPCTSTTSFAPLRASRASAASYGLCATITSGRCSRARRRTRSGSSA